VNDFLIHSAGEVESASNFVICSDFGIRLELYSLLNPLIRSAHTLPIPTSTRFSQASRKHLLMIPIHQRHHV
jgi:hypothetical protein